MNKTEGKKTKDVTHPVINQLVQLQELNLALSEQNASKQDKHLEKLDATIKSLLESLPEETRLLFRKIQKKDLLAIVPISNNVCSGCGLMLPISLVYAVRAGEKLYQCTNCGRLLYYPDVRPRRISRKNMKHSKPRRVGIARFSSVSLMMPHLQAGSRDGVFKEMAFKMAEEGFVDNAPKLLEEALQREAIISTAVDNGIAFPHVRGVEGGGVTLALGISHKGIRFDSKERERSHIIFFIAIPTAASVFYLRLLSGLTQTFARKDARVKLINAPTPKDLWTVLTKLTRTTVK